MSENDAIDVDIPSTWPQQTHEWADERAERLAGSTEYVLDLRLPLEQEDAFRATFGARKLVAYHCTRLLPHEVDGFRADGLRLLDETLVHDRLEAAVANGAIPPSVRAHAETNNIYAIDNREGRERQICFVLGRSVFDQSPGGCEPLLAHWGGEAMRGGPADAAPLTTIGTPSIVVAKLNLTSSHRHSRTGPPLANMFVGTLLGLQGRWADVYYRDPVPAQDIVAIQQPGDREYDRHAKLPR